jgi:hypothetical protein
LVRADTSGGLTVTSIVHIQRQIDDQVIEYTVVIPSRRMVDYMRIEQMKPGVIVSANVEEEIT